MAGGLAVVTHAISEEGTVAWLQLSTVGASQWYRLCRVSIVTVLADVARR
jgi:hypothetical protein